VLFAVISSFVLAELGDKTMLATVALASEHNWAGVWIGATAGMVLADGVAIALGVLLHKRLPERFLHGLASVLFLLFGLWLLFDAALGLRWIALAVTAFVAVTAVAMAVVRNRREHSLAMPPLESSSD
jgi:putative Ca2+/H+ antiporter (TMEM165/GDT1 family)